MSSLLKKLNGQKGNKSESETLEDLKRAAEIQSLSPVDPALELLDPNPNIHQLFQQFDTQFFWGKLVAVEVKWSPRMTQCAGICRYQTRSGFCTIGLSKPLLTLRPRKDLIETLLHEMIHAFLFVTHNSRDRDGHGPQFHKHMYRINNQIGSNISVYHTFHDEVRAQKVHVWRCEGPCKDRPPFYGYVRRSMNRAPGPHDLWHNEHKANCGGTFTKILEPPNFKSKKKGTKETKPQSQTDEPTTSLNGTPKITSVYTKTDISSQFNLPSSFVAFSGTGHKLGSSTTTSTQSSGRGAISGGGVKGKTRRDSNDHDTSRDISSFFTKNVIKIPSDPDFNLSQGKSSNPRADPAKFPSSSQTVSNSKRTNKSSSPKKTSSGSKDISSYFNKTELDISSDTDLLILSPPTKRKRLTPPSEEPNKQTNSQTDRQTNSQTGKLACPVCNKTGFTDLNIHANMCLNNQLLSSSQNDSKYRQSPVKSQNSVIVLDDSIEEVSLRKDILEITSSGESVPSGSCENVSKSGKSRDCPICGKSISSNLDKHLKICIESIPDDFDDDLLIIEDEKSISKHGETKAILPNSRTDSVSLSNEVNCPICGVKMLQSRINPHLDECLSSNKFS